MSRGRVVIVGGGVIGTMHAREGRRRDFEVVQLEADEGPRRASVRNFGLVWVSGRAVGAELAAGLRARELWEEVAAEAPGIGFRADGSITVATDEAELAVMKEVAARRDAAERQFELLDAAGVAAANPAVRGEVVGGLLCRRDGVVEPGSVLPAVRERLVGGGGYRWMAGRRAVAVGTGAVVDHRGERHEGDVVVVCPGAAHIGLGGAVGAALAGAPLRRCRLQMMQTTPATQRLVTSVADGDSMRYYPAFDVPARHGLAAPAEETAAFGMQLLLVQRRGGELTIGDTHVYDEPFDFAVEEFLYERLRERAEAVLGWRIPPVARRWAGVYSAATDDRVCFREEVEPGVVVVTGAAGRGMTLSPAMAEQTWEELCR